MGNGFLIISTMLVSPIIWLASFISHLVGHRARAWPPEVRRRHPDRSARR